MALAPPRDHWWHVPLYVTPRGLTTTAIPNGRRSFQVDFDFVDHRLQVIASDPASFTMVLEPKSVARFYREFMDGLRSLGINARISTKPVEVADAIRFEADEQHASYEPRHAELFWRGLLQADRVMKAFQSGFVGKASPVQFFWGSFDLAAARYNSRPAPRHPGRVPHGHASVIEEESCIGWWPQSVAPGPTFYAYTYPEPDGFRSARVRPAAAYFDAGLGEFVLPYDAVREAPDPDAAALEFFQSTYVAGADLAGWDRLGLEPVQRAERPPYATGNTSGDPSPNEHGRQRARPQEPGR
jgi:Family of unknown function (DUF5996)